MPAGALLKHAGLIVAASVMCGQIAIPDPRQYRNIDYQFSVRIPSGYKGCMNSAPNPNHGVWIPLDNTWPCENSDDPVSYISINANYNAAGNSDTAKGLAQIECRWRKARHIVWLSGETIGGRKAAGCRRTFPDGHIETRVLILRKTNRSIVQWIEVSADLVTSPARYGADMRVFRRLLRDIWVHPDGPLQ
jgi:hypothetical protein